MDDADNRIRKLAKKGDFTPPKDFMARIDDVLLSLPPRPKRICALAAAALVATAIAAEICMMLIIR